MASFVVSLGAVSVGIAYRPADTCPRVFLATASRVDQARLDKPPAEQDLLRVDTR
jgi:hypothetical protein